MYTYQSMTSTLLQIYIYVLNKIMYYLLTYIHDFYNLHLQVLNLVCKQQTRTGRRMTNHQFAIHRHLLLRPSCCQITTSGLRTPFNLFLCGLENLIDVNKD